MVQKTEDLVLSELPLLRVPRLRRLTAEALQKAPRLRQARAVDARLEQLLYLL